MLEKVSFSKMLVFLLQKKIVFFFEGCQDARYALQMPYVGVGGGGVVRQTSHQWN